MSHTDQLEVLAKTLEVEGAEPLRIELVRRARRFKRTWIEMAEALVQVRTSRAYEGWGHSDFFSYCAEELLIKRRTVEKLTGSYNTLQRHAPDVLEGTAEPPSFDSVDYFNRALQRAGHNDEAGWQDLPESSAPSEALEDLKQAVFEEGRPISSLRKQFHPILFRKSVDEAQLEQLEKASQSARRLTRLLPEIGGLSPACLREATAALEGLGGELDLLLEKARSSDDHRQAS